MSKRFLLTAMFCLAVTVTGPASLAQDAGEHYEKAIQSYHEGKFKEAYIHLKNTLQQDSAMIPARLLLAQVYFSVGDIASAEKECGEALLLGADINLVLPIYGPALVLQRKIDTLFEIENSAGDFTPDSRFEWALLKGQGYLLRGEPELARAEFERAAAMRPADARSLNSLASIYMNSGMTTDALELAEQSLELDPENAKSWELRAELAFGQEAYAEALEYLQTAFGLDSEDFRIQRALARVYLHLGDRENAKKFLDLILAQSPDDPAATLLSAILVMGEGGSELGETMLDSLSNSLSEMDYLQSQSNDTMLFIQASADYIRGNDQSAITLLNAYLSRNRSDIGALSMLSDLYLRNGDENEALELLSANESVASADLGLSLQLVHLYLQQHQLYSARKLLAQVKARSQGVNPFVRLLEAELLMADGLPEEALSFLNRGDFGDREPVSYGLLRGALQLQLRKFPEAQDSVLQLRENFPDNIRVLNFCAFTYLSLGQLAEAEICIDEALAQSPSNVESRFSQAMLLKKRGSFQESGTVLNNILDERPSHTRSILLMARIMFEQGDYQDALDWSEKALTYDRRSNLPEELKLDVYTAMADWKSARFIATRLARNNPRNAGYFERLAIIHMTLGEREMALQRLERLAELWSGDVGNLRRLAGLQVQVGALPEARKSLEAALLVDPESYVVRLDLAGIDFLEGDLAGATRWANELERVYGQKTELALLQGDIALQQGRKEQAHAFYLQSFELDHNNRLAIQKLYEMGQQGVGVAESTAALEAALRESSLSVLAVRLLADTYLTQGDMADAARYYEQLLQLEEVPDEAGILNNLANIYAAEDLDKALATARRGLEVEGGASAALLDTVGWILIRQGKNEESLPYLRKAYSKNSRDPEIRYHIGVALLELGRDAEAATELRAALSVQQEFAWRDEAQRKLASIAQ